MSALPTANDWQKIDTILLDMDGTILDLSYDNFFWLEHIPKVYAKNNSISISHAKQYVIDAINNKRGTLEWYCTDYWSDFFKLNIKQLKHDTRHKVKILDNTIEFLEWAAKNKRVIMATNAHRDGLNIKLATSGIEKYFDTLITSHDYGYAKEEQEFWQHFCKKQNVDKSRAFFIDDNKHVLESAKSFGIAYLAGINQHDFGNVANLNALLIK